MKRKVVGNVLSPEFKQIEKIKVEQPPRVPASQRIEKKLGKEVVERHREEVKQELLKDKDFIVEVISKAPEILDLNFR